MLGVIELDGLEIKEGSAILREVDDCLEALGREPSAIYIFEDQRTRIARGIRGALRRCGRPAGMKCKEFEDLLKPYPFLCQWKYRGHNVVAQVGRVSPAKVGQERSSYE